MINIDSLSFQYTSKPIFENFCWQVQKGDSWAILGPSGCGKSTLLSLLAGMLYPTGGKVWINDENLTRPRPQTGLILQDYGLLPWATVRQNVGLGLELRKFYGSDGVHAPRNQPRAGSVNDWLDRLGIFEIADKYPNQISGGQRQRAAIARTLILRPDLLLMDEPFSSLDAPTRETMQNLTRELVLEQELTLILVTHSIEESACLGRKILLLGNMPIQKAKVIENPEAGLPGYRDSITFQALCKELRSLMDKNKDL